MSAQLLFRDKYIYADGAIREMVIWRLPEADSERAHGLKYSLFYGHPGKCLVRYDNERGKAITGMQVIKKHRMTLRPLNN
jgi:hypothetical protein